MNFKIVVLLLLLLIGGCGIQSQINNGGKNNKYVIKISGIWETASKIGLTYKILEL